MFRFSRIRWPKFSLTGLFWFATAVTLGFAISKTSIEERKMTLFGLRDRAFYSPTLIAIGAVLVVYELLRQAILLRQSHADLPVDRTTLGFAVGVRGLLAAGIATALVYKQLINRQFIIPVETDDFLWFCGELWPSTVLLLMLFVSMRMMTSPRRKLTYSRLVQTGATLVVSFGLMLIFVYMITDRNAIGFLVHVAIANVEMSHAQRWQRMDAFPDHVAEGFQAFWESLRAASIIVLGGICVVAAARTSRRSIAFLLLGMSFVSVAYGFSYAYWFVAEEFHRIDPDLASQGFSGLTYEWAGGTLLMAALSLILGDRLARESRRDQDLSNGSRIALPSVSGLMAIAALFVAVGCGSDFVRTWYDSMGMPSGWYASSLWLDRIASFVSLLTYPEQMIPLGAALAGIRIIWQYYRGPEQQAWLQPTNLPHTMIYSTAVLIWLLAAVPTFAIFGFCYWLGPWVL